MIIIENGLYSRDGFDLHMDFALERGSITSVVGPSGAGKSTLLNVIGGFEALRQGRIILDGVDATGLHPSARPVSSVFQDNNAFAHLTARDNVALGIIPSLRLTPQNWERVDSALQRVGLASLATRKPGEMSGGERQRIALARVLVRQKPILLLDEPFAALGPGLRKEMMALLKDVLAEQALTVMMVTHQPDDAKTLGGSVVFVNEGCVRKPVPIADFFLAPDAEVARYLGL